MFAPADHVGAYRVVIAPDGSTVELLLESCP
jgi:hypothetical protein